MINILLALVLISEIYFFYFPEIEENEKELDTWLGYYLFSAEFSWYALRQEYPKLEEKGEGVKGIYFKKAE